jgi:broad specificity phosphatase PhoE
MSTLTLVRHGQAAPFEKESDVLSPLGEQQARALARHWLENGTAFDEIYTGTLVRQRRTEETVAAVFRETGVHWPEAQASVLWNEYDAAGVLTHLVPALAVTDERFAELVMAFEGARGTPGQNRHFQRMFEVAMVLWLEGAMDIEHVEPFHAFEHRIHSALAAVQARAGSRRVAVFTSGGPIGLLVQHVLKAPKRTFLEVNWRVKNGSITEFVFGNGRISLDSFNDAGHLRSELRSFR